MCRLVVCFFLVRITLFGCASLGSAAPARVAISINAPNRETLRRIHVPPPNGDVFDGRKRLPPSLPPGAAAKNLTGQVRLRVTTGKEGDVQKVVVAQSSGSKLLDETARTWAQHIWQYPPASKEETRQEQVDFKAEADSKKREAASAAEGRSVYPDTPRPPYPYIAMMQGWQGDVKLKLVPDGWGKVKTAEILSSSGVPLLDLIAKAWCESYWSLPNNLDTVASLAFRLH